MKFEEIEGDPFAEAPTTANGPDVVADLITEAGLTPMTAERMSREIPRYWPTGRHSLRQTYIALGASTGRRR